MRLRPLPRLGLLRQPSVKLSLSCTKRIFQKSRKSRAQLLSLGEGEKVTQKILDSSPILHLRQAADEAHPPTVIGAHWIDHLEDEGCIATCKPHDFKFEEGWLPLYTRAGVTRQVSSLSSLLKAHGDSPLIAVIPPDMLFQSEQEYVISQLHEADCLSQVTLYYGKNQRKQIEFCPYCGVMNKNTATTYSHAREAPRDHIPLWGLL